MINVRLIVFIFVGFLFVCRPDVLIETTNYCAITRNERRPSLSVELDGKYWLLGPCQTSRAANHWQSGENSRFLHAADHWQSGENSRSLHAADHSLSGENSRSLHVADHSLSGELPLSACSRPFAVARKLRSLQEMTAKLLPTENIADNVREPVICK